MQPTLTYFFRRAVYGEFCCSLLFYTPIFGTIMNFSMNDWSPQVMSLTVAFVGGLQGIACSFAFSSVSGAHYNSAISFALWLTGKLSNRKAVMYIFVQMLASVVAMALCSTMFAHNDRRDFRPLLWLSRCVLSIELFPSSSFGKHKVDAPTKLAS